MEKDQKASLDIKTRKFEVDMAQNLISQENRANLTMAEVKGCLTLPMKTKYHWKKVPPKGDFNYEIKLTGSANNADELSAGYFTANPITCKIQGSEQRASKGTFHVETCDSKLDLFFDASKVKDCPQKLTEDRTFNLPFQLVISDETSSFTIDDYLEVTIKKFKPHLKFQFVSDYSSQHKLIYSESFDRCQAEKKLIDQDEKLIVQVGKLIVSHNASYSCAPAITNELFKLTCAVRDGGADSTVEENERHDLLRMEVENNRKDMSYTVKCLEPGQHIDLPVWFYMTDAFNPTSANTPNTFTPIINNRREMCCGHFDLWRNQVLTKKKVYFQLPDTKLKDGDITNHNSKDMGELFLVEQEDTDYILTLTFANEADATDAQHPHAAVLVWDVAFDRVDYDRQRVKTRNNKDLKDIFKITVDAGQHWELSPARNKTCHLPIKMKAGDIEGIIPLYDEDQTFADISLHLTYHAIEDDNGEFYHQVKGGRSAELGEKGKQTCDLMIRLKKQPHSEWLCVDFGTSAVVAAYARDTLNENKSLINLKKLKGRLLDITYGIGDPKNDNSDEDENLISSTVCFNNSNDTVEYNNVDGMPESFKTYSVWFSPSVKGIERDYLLPCLKTIIGYKHLPNIFTEDKMKTFKYRCDGKDIALMDDEGIPTPLMKVSEVAKIIYRQLFKYYLSKRFDRKGQLVPRNVNKLVLSVPNTYTPLDIQSVKELARDSMPSIYPEYLHTISESDAVACYYVSHHKEFLGSIADVDKRDRLSKKESVLVFDMGAGTLDLTWFVKEAKHDENGQIVRTDIFIMGKLGVSKAGNYIDYELAEILREIYNEKTTTNGKYRKGNDNDDKFKQAMLFDRSEAEGNMESMDDRVELKNYVKELKKMLSAPDKEVPRLELNRKVYFEGDNEGNANSRRQQSISLKMKDILENTHFKRIINEMTKDVLQTFGHRYGDEKGKLDIDVLIFSGRSTSLIAIREGVKQHISSICRKPDQLFYADLCESKLSIDIHPTSDMSNSLLKTVVTQGALAYATMFSNKDAKYQLHVKKYYASFGLVKYYSDRTYEYIPLIDDRMTDKPSEANGTIESRIYKVETRNLTQVDLIQSYSSNEAEDYSKGNFDTISKLCEMPCQGLKDFNVQLIMNTQSESSANTTLTFLVGQGCNRLDPHVDFNNVSLRKSLWPVIFDNGDNLDR